LRAGTNAPVQRVAAGGHDVPDEKIVERFPRTLANAAPAVAFVDHARVYDNSSAMRPFRLLARFDDGLLRERRGPLPSWADDLLHDARQARAELGLGSRRR
jgi:predicted ABC-type ATPase